MKILLITILSFLFSSCNPQKKVSKLSKAEQVKQNALRLSLTSEFYLKDYLKLGGLIIKQDEGSIKEAKRMVVTSKVPLLLLKTHKCESVEPEYKAIKNCVLTTMQDNSIFPAFFKASTDMTVELMKNGLITSQFQK